MADLDPKALTLEALSGMLLDESDLGYMEDALPALTALRSSKRYGSPRTTSC